MKTILVIDDNPLMRMRIRYDLERSGYLVLEAANGRQALGLFRSSPVDIAVVDIFMPEMDGKELSKPPQILRPALRVVFMPGYLADVLEQHSHMPADLHILHKPFTSAALAQHIRAALDAPPLKNKQA